MINQGFLQITVFRYFSVITLLLIACFLSGCSNLSTFLFYPQKHYYQYPEQLGLNAERVNIKTKDGETLVNWFLKSPIETKGTILFLHGNGENISTHINSVAWLPKYGYEVFLLDYRGYGESSGTSTLASAFQDIDDAHRWLSARQESSPLFVLGQSMGGALAITYTAQYDKNLNKIAALIAESAPASWPQVAREAMSKSWVTWLLQIPVSLIPSEYDAQDHIGNIKATPILLMHSKQDPVVAYHHSQQLFERGLGRAQWIETEGGHIGGFNGAFIREKFLDFLEANGI